MEPSKAVKEYKDENKKLQEKIDEYASLQDVTQKMLGFRCES